MLKWIKIKMKDLFSTVMARAKFVLRGEVATIDMVEIPLTRSKFLDTENEWIAIPYPSSINATGCQFYGVAGFTFPKHKHKFSREELILESGRIEIFTPKRNFILDATDGVPKFVSFDKNEPHIVDFLTDCELALKWRPRMKTGWNAEFENV